LEKTEKTRIASIKVWGDFHLVGRVLHLIEANFDIVKESPVLPNDRDKGVHSFITLAEEVKG
jgi:hypothetical protein